MFVLYAYGGWTHAAYVAAEVRDQRRNLPRALMLGIAGITLIYLAVNATYLAVLGFDGARQTPTPAADVMEHAVGPWGGRAISVLVMLSALGAINGMILTGSRIYATWGADYPALAWLGEWNRRAAAPVAAIALQAVIAVAVDVLVGTDAGRDLFDAALASRRRRRLAVGTNTPADSKRSSPARRPSIGHCALLTGIAVFVLRASGPTSSGRLRCRFFRCRR